MVRRSSAVRSRSEAPSAAVVSVRAPDCASSEISSGRAQSRSARSDEMPTSRPSSTSVRTSSTMRGWSVTAAPTSPTRRASSGSSSSTRSGSTVRIPPLVVRLMTQYVHPREHPRSGSIRNIERSSVCGVMICERAGSRSSSAFATPGQVEDRPGT